MQRGACYAVRKAGVADLLAVVRLVNRSPGLKLEGLTDLQWATWDRMMVTPDLNVYVAETAREAVGMTSLLVMPHVTYDCQPTAFIEPLVVAEAHRRRGVARMMVERVLHDARAARCRKVQVLSHKRHADDGAHSFYRALGFTREADGFRLYL